LKKAMSEWAEPEESWSAGNGHYRWRSVACSPGERREMRIGTGDGLLDSPR
jgi:hypothetical protein